MKREGVPESLEMRPTLLANLPDIVRDVSTGAGAALTTWCPGPVTPSA